MGGSLTIEEISWLLNAAFFDDVAGCVPSAAEEKEPKFFAYRGFAKWRLGQFEGAIEDFSVALALLPNAPSTRFLRARCYEELERYSEAVADYEEVLKIAPHTADAYAHLGYCRERLGDAERALLNYLTALDINSGETLAISGVQALRTGSIH